MPVLLASCSWVSSFCSRSLRTKRPKMVLDRKSTRLNSSHANISYAVFCLKKKKKCTRGDVVEVDRMDHTRVAQVEDVEARIERDTASVEQGTHSADDKERHDDTNATKFER